MESILKISDLSIGDWVKAQDSELPYQIYLIDWQSGTIEAQATNGALLDEMVCDIRPIPITAEILEKSGFKRSDDYDGTERTPYLFRKGEKKSPYDKVTVNIHHPTKKTPKRMFKNGIYHELVYESPAIANTWTFVFVRYVHELQHALRLAGIDKEILP